MTNTLTSNQTTWNSKITIDMEDSYGLKLLEKIRHKTNSNVDEDDKDEPEVSAGSGDEIAIINNTGLKKINAIISLNGSLLNSIVICPSGIMYKFSVEISDSNLDIQWWQFAFKHYKVYVSNSSVKEKLINVFNLDEKTKMSLIHKGKNKDEFSNLSLNELIDLVFPNS